MNVLKRNTLFGAAAIALSVILLSGFDKEVRNDQLNNIRANFANPPATSRPGVYWYFMDGNLSRQGITDDLEAMKKAGIGNVVFLEVNVGVPRGKVDFLSEEWQELFTYAVRESERLGITITLGVGPGWAGSGGPWVQGKLSMQHLVSSVTVVDGAAKSKIILPVPDPKKPYFDFAFTPELEKRWKEFYEDVAVLAFPEPAKSEKITGVDDKALYYRAPYTSTPNVSAYIPSLAVYPEASAEAIIPKEN
ncbi:MAG: glycosyl hydrolase, partial [Sphingobacteriales bacterium]